MDVALLRLLIPLAALLLLSAYFSGSEAAFFSLSTLEQDSLKRRSGTKLAAILSRIFASPDDILITLLTGNMFVNVFASSLAEAIGERIFPFETELFSIISMTVLLLIFGEMAPKNIAVRSAPSLSRFSAVPLHYLSVLLTPLRWFFNLFNRLVNLLIPAREADEQRFKHSIIRSAVQIGFKEGILDRSELDLVESFCDFREKQAEDLMIPRTEINGVDVSRGIFNLIADGTLMDESNEAALLPAFDQDLDHLVGYIAFRDLLPYKFRFKKDARLTEIVRTAISVPATKNCADLLVEMRESNSEMAVVIDEYGGTAGIVTFKDLVEQLLGYFYPTTEKQIVELPDGGFRIAGQVKIEELVALLGQEILSDSNTVAGLIIDTLGEIPAAGTKLIIGQIEFTVKRIGKTRILELEVRRVSR
ncbi:MAG: HlyC/CorC family transporter [Spirochaetaceae bacterium]|nr:MAG: HlyC/CorC family transporter [Spirochaetaceae bacterium]